MDAIILTLTEVWTLSLLIAACIALPSGILQGYAGFGGALFASPLFTLLFGPVTAFSILIILMLFSQMPLYSEALRKADWREFAPIAASSAIVMRLGVFFLVPADPSVIRLVWPWPPKAQPGQPPIRVAVAPAAGGGYNW